MDELKNGLDVAIHGEEADRAVRKVRDVVSSWGLQLPEVKPLVLDFGLGDFEKTGEVEFWIANENEAGYCGKFLFVFPGQTCPEHMHKEKLETFFIVKGKVTMHCGEEILTMTTGDVLKVETGTRHSFTGIEPTLLLEVSKPSIIADNYFTNEKIPIGGNYKP